MEDKYVGGVNKPAIETTCSGETRRRRKKHLKKKQNKL